MKKPVKNYAKSVKTRLLNLLCRSDESDHDETGTNVQ